MIFEKNRLIYTEPAVVLVLRGVGAFNRVESVVKSRGPHQTRASSEVALDKMMSATPEMAYRCGKYCFTTTTLTSSFDYSVTV